MHLSTSTVTDDLHHPHSRYHPHHHQSMAYDYAPDAAPGSGGRMGYAASEMSSSDYALSWRRGSRQGVLILITFLIEFLLLVFVVIMEYFLRWVSACALCGVVWFEGGFELLLLYQSVMHIILSFFQSSKGILGRFIVSLGRYSYSNQSINILCLRLFTPR